MRLDDDAWQVKELAQTMALLESILSMDDTRLDH